RMVACMFTDVPGGAGLPDEVKVTWVATCAGPPTTMVATGDTEAALTKSPELGTWSVMDAVPSTTERGVPNDDMPYLVSNRLTVPVGTPVPLMATGVAVNVTLAPFEGFGGETVRVVEV